MAGHPSDQRAAHRALGVVEKERPTTQTNPPALRLRHGALTGGASDPRPSTAL